MNKAKTLDIFLEREILSEILLSQGIKANPDKLNRGALVLAKDLSYIKAKGVSHENINQ